MGSHLSQQAWEDPDPPAPAPDPPDPDRDHGAQSPAERDRSFEEGLRVLRRSSDPLAQDLVRALEAAGRFGLRLFREHQELKSRLVTLEAQQQGQATRLLDENKRLQQTVQELRYRSSSSSSSSREPPRAQPTDVRTPRKGVRVQFWAAGRTEGCESQFLQDVARLLSLQAISLEAKESAETSKDLLLVFCPIGTRIGTDIENALEKFWGEQKILLVVMHYAQKDSTVRSVDIRWQGSHPAVVRTVHARYTLQDGLYPCEMNRLAVADVAAAIKGLAEDR